MNLLNNHKVINTIILHLPRFMKFLIVFVALLSAVSSTILIETQSDVDRFRFIRSINDNVLIKGDNNITNIDALSNVKNISGYLIVWNTNMLRTLYPINQLTNVRNITIVDNQQLCYVNTINWTLITSSTVTISNNNIHCPSCDIECNGCWNNGPQACQLCQNYKSGITCVNQCPIGTIANTNMTCTESILKNIPDLDYVRCKQNCFVLNWNDMNVTGGVIIGYRIRMNNDIISEMNSTHDFQYDDYHKQNITIDKLNYNTNYSFSLELLNSVGWSISNPLIVSTLDAPPLAPINITYQSFPQSVNISWSKNNDSGFIEYYLIEFVSQNQTEYFTSITTNINITELIHNTKYQFRIMSIQNQLNSSFSEYINFTTTVGLPFAPHDLIVYNISDHNVEIQWNATENITQYWLESNNTNVIGNATGNSIIFDGLNEFMKYTFRVRSFNQFGVSNYTSILFETLINKNFSLMIPNVNVNQSEIYVTLLNNISFISKKHLTVFIKHDDMLTNTDLMNITSNSVRLSDYLILNTDEWYAFQVHIVLMDNTTMSSNISKFVTIGSTDNDNNKEKIYFGFTIGGLIITAIVILIPIIIILVIAIKIIKRKKNKINSTTLTPVRVPSMIGRTDSNKYISPPFHQTNGIVGQSLEHTYEEISEFNKPNIKVISTSTL